MRGATLNPDPNLNLNLAVLRILSESYCSGSEEKRNCSFKIILTPPFAFAFTFLINNYFRSQGSLSLSLSFLINYLAVAQFTFGLASLAGRATRRPCNASKVPPQPNKHVFVNWPEVALGGVLRLILARNL